MVTTRSSRRRATGLAVALGAVTMLFAAPSAGAATFSSGKVSLSFGQKFATALKATKTRVRGTGGTVVRGRTATFNVRIGNGTLASPYSAALDLGGTLDFKRGRRTARLKNLDEVVSNRTGRFKSGRSTIFSEAPRGKVAAEAGFDGLDARGVRIKLTRSGARALNRKLRTSRFKTNMTAGTLRFDAERSVTFQSGETRVALDNGFAAKLASCGVTVEAIPPATRTEGPTRFTFPVTGGLLSVKTLDGAITNGGGLRLAKASTGKQSTLTEIELGLTPTQSSFTALASDAGGARLEVGSLEPSPTAQTQLTATGGTVTFSGATLRLNGTAAGLLAGNYGCTNVSQGEPLGFLETAGGQVK